MGYIGYNGYMGYMLHRGHSQITWNSSSSLLLEVHLSISRQNVIHVLSMIAINWVKILKSTKNV